MRPRYAASVMALALLSAACGSAEPSARTVSIATQAPPPPGEVACMMALLEGTLALDPRTGLGVASADGRIQPVRWPNGWHASETTPITLIDGNGTTIARVGDHISMAGGFGVDDVWTACPYDLKVS